MTWFDWAVLVIVGLSMVLSVYRGFVREALSLVAWVTASVVAFTLGEQMSGLLVGVIDNDTLRYVGACVILFAATLVLGSLLNRLLGQLIKMTGLSGADRLLGTVFGFTRGLLVVLVLLFVLEHLLPADQQASLQSSVLLPHLKMVIQWAETNFSSLADSGQIPWPIN
jgi:membrane protein required for colicin V production